MPSRGYALIDEELAALGPDEKNWRGIGIALLVIFSVCALIVTAVVLLTPGDKSHHRGKEKISLADFLDGVFTPKSFNGTWISDDEFLYRGPSGALEIYNVVNDSRKIIMESAHFKHKVFYHYSLSPDRKYILLQTDYEKVFRYTYLAVFLIYDINNDQVNPLLQKDPELKLQYAGWGPVGNQLAYVYQNNIYYMSSIGSNAVQLTKTGIEDLIYNGIPDWVYEEEILSSSKAFWWSQDGTKLCYASFNDSKVDEIMYPYYGSYKDSKNVYPEIVNLHYPKSGRTNPSVTLWIADLTNYKESQLINPPDDYKDIEYYFTATQWINSDSISIIWIKRAQNASIVSICKEKNKWNCEKSIEVNTNGHGWVDLYSPPIFTPENDHYFLILPGPEEGNSGRFLHLAMINVKDGVYEFLTKGKYEVTNVIAYDSKKKLLYYIATLEDKPGQRHLFSVTSTLPSRITCLTCDLGQSCLYNSATFSKNSSYYILECSGPEVPRVEIKSPNYNDAVLVLETNEKLKKAIKGKAMPQVKKLQVPLPGNYMANVKLLLPPNLREDEITKYPMVVEVYAGPGTQIVKETFNVNWGHYLASGKNIIYATIDGRGSGFQGLKMRYELYRRLGTVEVQDQIFVAKYLRDHLSYIDSKKIAMFGWSYGGYATARVLATDDENIFCCGISVAPVTSWLYYDSVYTERFMQMPTENDNLKSYEESEVMNKASHFKGKKFLLVHGTADDNVHWQQSVMLTKALTEAGVLFRMQVYPDERHALSNVKLHLYRMVNEFLDQSFSDDAILDDT